MESNYESGSGTTTVIDHMAIDDPYIFGSTRSTHTTNTGWRIYIWRIQFLNGSNYLDTSSNNVREIDHQDVKDITSYVTGIKKTLTNGGDNIHMVLSTGNQ